MATDELKIWDICHSRSDAFLSHVFHHLQQCSCTSCNRQCQLMLLDSANCCCQIVLTTHLSGNLLQHGPGQPVPRLRGLQLVVPAAGVQQPARDEAVHVCGEEGHQQSAVGSSNFDIERTCACKNLQYWAVLRIFANQRAPSPNNVFINVQIMCLSMSKLESSSQHLQRLLNSQQ